jgi:hypothetical protein
MTPYDAISNPYHAYDIISDSNVVSFLTPYDIMTPYDNISDSTWHHFQLHRESLLTPYDVNSDSI